MSTSSQPQSTFISSCIPRGTLTLTDLLTAVAALLARHQPHNAPLLHSAWTVHEVITEGYRILKSVHCELGTFPQAAWIQVFEKRLSLWCQLFPQSRRALYLWCILASGAQGIADVYVQYRPFSVESRPSSVGCSARSGFVTRLPEHAWGNAAMTQSGSSGTCLLTLLPILCLFLSSVSVARSVLFLIRLRPKT